MGITNISKICAAALAAAGLFLLLSIVMALFSPLGGGILGSAGLYLLICFNAAAFFVPVYLGVVGILLLMESFSPRRFIVLMGSLVPFITLGIFLQIFSEGNPSPAELFLTRQFGQRGAGILLLTLLFAELLVLLRVALIGGSEGSPKGEAGGTDPVVSTLGAGKPSRLVSQDRPPVIKSGEEDVPESATPPSDLPSQGEPGESSLSSMLRESFSPVLESQSIQPESPEIPAVKAVEPEEPVPFDESELAPLEPVDEPVKVDWETEPIRPEDVPLPPPNPSDSPMAQFVSAVPRL